MRLLVLNANTDAAITERLCAAARERLGDEAEVVGSTARFGAAYIASRAAAAIAAHAALDAFARDGAGCDAALIACFGDPGLLALKEIAPVPVVGMAEASCHAACLLGRRFSIVTGGARWPAMLEEFVAAQGLSTRLASIRAVAPTGDRIAADPGGALADLAAAARACVEDDGAECVILAGAGLVGLAERIAPAVPVPVLCSFAASLETTVALARLAPRRAQAGSLAATPGVVTRGLGEGLAGMMGG